MIQRLVARNQQNQIGLRGMCPVCAVWLHHGPIRCSNGRIRTGHCLPLEHLRRSAFMGKAQRFGGQNVIQHLKFRQRDEPDSSHIGVFCV
jgi:hypothetical protein